MIKKVFGRKLSRSRPAREALFSALAKSMVLSGKMVTTKAKAKAVQRDIEKCVSLAIKGTLDGRRKVLAYFDNAKDVTDVLFQKTAKLFGDKKSGFTRIINLPRRKGDNAEMVRMEWTYEDVSTKTKGN